MKLYILTEDTAIPGFEKEHGLSIYFEKDGKKFLFDTGQSGMFMRNAKKLNLDLNDIDYLILSHGHYDHTDGLKFINIPKKTKIICHPLCIKPKYYGKKYIGFPDVKLNIDVSEGMTKLSNNVCFLGQIPGDRKRSLGEVADNNERKKDFLLDDTGIAITEDDNLIVIVGCAHSGIVNITKYAISKFPRKKVYVIGGFHMNDLAKSEIEKVIMQLDEIGVSDVYPGHCTGEDAIATILGHFSGSRLSAGKQIDI
ncbi:MAG: MBL fold metallo-hydrolase [Phycisphaerae bacterium]|jgi:7,8-dihydropterin-6-yl-methyl-4-(beta-D-ribofuranosyl)aminobenzene 5'-phosphate synthase